jgi:hypothetical protein
MTENTNEAVDNTTEVIEKVIGDYKPKKKFLNFVSVVNRVRVRFISDVAFIKGERLAGLGLDGVIFKVTICDEGTIKFEEVDTNVTDFDYRKRLIDDICDSDVTGYAQKFVVNDFEFADKDGSRCYLEVEHSKPIDKLRSILEPEVNISEKGMSFLDDLLGSTYEETTDKKISKIEELVGVSTPEQMEVAKNAFGEFLMENSEEVTVSQTLFKSETKEELEREFEGENEIRETKSTYMEDMFKKMEEDKLVELKSRIEGKEKDIMKAKSEISNAEKRLDKETKELRILNSRLQSMSVKEEANGYVFYVSEEQKAETGLDENTKSVADKIADLMGLKKDVLFDHLTGSFYKIRIAKKGGNLHLGIDKEAEKVEKEIMEKISTIDVIGNISLGKEVGGFEYRGELNWHQLVARMIHKGFEQDPDWDKLCGSNSYESKTEELLLEDKKECACKGGDGKCEGDCKCNESSGGCGENCECKTKVDSIYFLDEDGNKSDFAYFEGSHYLDSLEDYWYEVKLSGNDIEIRDLHNGQHIDEIKEVIKTWINSGKENFYLNDKGLKCEYESTRAQIKN